jgi:hypothetical protein
MFIAEPDEGKLTIIDISVVPELPNSKNRLPIPDFTPETLLTRYQLKFKDQFRLGKLKTLLKGIEDTRIMQVIQTKDSLALELVQANY